MWDTNGRYGFEMFESYWISYNLPLLSWLYRKGPIRIVPGVAFVFVIATGGLFIFVIKNEY